MARQIVFLVLAMLAGLTIGVGAGYLLNYSHVSSLNSQNLNLQQQLSTTQNNLTAYVEACQTYQSLFESMQVSYQSLSIQYTNLMNDYNLARHNINSLNDTLAEMTIRYNTLVLINQYLLLNCHNATFLPDGSYYDHILPSLRAANSSIYVAMHAMSYEPGALNNTANTLVTALAEAKARGVDVRVLLDDYCLQHYPETISFLTDNGVPVLLDPSEDTTTNAKLVIVDGSTAFLGSADWTEECLAENSEMGVILRGSTSTATGYFASLWANGRQP